jgi:hypothetical protein
MEHIRCKYVGHNNVGCPHFVDGHSSFCFWHDPQTIKNTPDIKKRLETLIHDGYSLEGFALHRAALQNVNFSHANLMNARLYQADLSGANLLKANLEGANLNSTNLEHANLLGTRLENAHLEHTRWGNILLQEHLAKEAIDAGKFEDVMQLYGEAEEIARYLTNESEKRRQYDVSGQFYQLERVMRRMQMRRFSREWCWSKLLDILCGYGENAARVIGFSIFISVFAAIFYFFLGINSPNGLLIFDTSHTIEDNIFNFLECLYFSVITFTTTGYGDFSPIGFSRLVATLEAFIGAFAISLFVVVFVRKMTQ